MKRTIALASVVLLGLCGCADVQVRKISAAEGDDCVKGFRYCLSRPYVLVKQPILVRSRSWLEVCPAEPFGKPSVTPTDLSAPPAAATTAKGAIEIVFLPDFDEQYAVHNRCVCAHNQTKLTFRDGWQLQEVNAKLDSTAIANQLLQTIDTAVSLAGSKTVPSSGAGILGAASSGDAAGQHAERVLVQIKEDEIIPPGLYRVNKPWEMDEGTADCGADLLSRLGMRPVCNRLIVKIQPLAR